MNAKMLRKLCSYVAIGHANLLEGPDGDLEDGDFGGWHYIGIRYNDNLCRFCVLSLHREVGGVRQYTGNFY